MRESKTLPDARPMEEQIEELEKDIASKLEEIEELKSKLEEKDEDLSEKGEELETKEEEMQTKLSEMSSEIATLKKLIEGSDLIDAPAGDEVYEPGKSSRAKVISEFAKENNISEFAATLRLGKDRPEIFKL